MSRASGQGNSSEKQSEEETSMKSYGAEEKVTEKRRGQ